MKKISLKEEKFCQVWFETGVAIKGYRAAYDCSKSKDATQRRCCVDLCKKPHIIDYMDTLRAESKATFAVSAEQKKQWLQQVVEDGMKQKVKEGEDESIGVGMQDRKAVISAIAELNRMDGDLAAIKNENMNVNKYDGLSELQLDDKLAQLLAKT